MTPKKIPSPAEFIAEALKKYAGKKLLIDAKTGTSLTYGDLDLLTKRSANLIRSFGIKRGNVVSLLLNNSLSFFTPWLGAVMTGASVHLISTLSTAERVAYETDLCETKLLVSEARFAKVIEEAGINNRKNIRIIYLEEFLKKLAEFPGSLDKTDYGSNDQFQLICTSGTTGKPKAVVQHNGMVWPDIQAVINAYELSGDDVTLLVNRLFHVNAQYMSFLPMLVLGGKVVVSEKFEPELFWQSIKAQKITYSSLVPPANIMLLKHLPMNKSDYASLKFFIFGADVLTAEDHKNFVKTTGVAVKQVWGMTETGCAGSASPPNEPVVFGSIGKPIAGAEMMVVDPENGWRELPANKIGRLIFKGPMSFREYLKNNEATIKTFAPGNGFFDTGDLCYKDSDGNFFFVDRASLSFKLKGEYVRPWDITNVIKRIDGIEDAFVHFLTEANGDKAIFACVVWKDKPLKTPQDVWRYVDGERGKPNGIDWNFKVKYVIFIPKILVGAAKRDMNSIKELTAKRVGGENIPGWEEMFADEKS